MDKEIKREAARQYFRYFRVWFIIAGVLLTVWMIFMVGRLLNQKNHISGNDSAPQERVYDYAQVLTEEEEASLRQHIDKREEEYQIHLVLVTTSIDMEGTGSSWEEAMTNYADDFYDENQYGYNMIHGDGALLLDNWYEGQEGSWLSTCGSVERTFSNQAIDRVLDAVGDRVESDPYQAYMAYVDEVCRQMADADGGVRRVGLSDYIGVLFIATVVALIYLFTNLGQPKAKDTTNAYTYVREKKPVVTNQQDEFIRKTVTHVHIQRSSSGGSSRSGSSGGGGHHVSRGGVSHGGGGRRR
ncbi:MAG: TPM domain-containing protein [Roseburia sp.]|nr:TPM domain-containing protein [Roseburia sp.]